MAAQFKRPRNPLLAGGPSKLYKPFLSGNSYRLKRPYLSGPRNSLLNPLQILGSVNLPFWMRADAGMYLDTGFTMPTTSNNATILGIQDQSGNADNATQATSGNAYTLLTNQINGLPALQAPTTGFYALASSIVLSGTFALYVVSSPILTSRMVTIGGGTGAGCLLNVESNNISYILNDAGDNVNTSTSVVSGSWQGFRVRRNASGGIFLCYSGQSELSLGALTGNITLTTLFERSSVVSTMISLFAEMFVANVDTVTSGQDAALRAWVSGRYGLTIP